MHWDALVELATDIPSKLIDFLFYFFGSHCSDVNVIVVGDYIRDAEVVDDFGFKNVLKIGLLNPKHIDCKECLACDKCNQSLATYLEKFDAVLLNDQSFSFVNNIVRQLLDSRRKRVRMSAIE
jgi:hypothetical protein